ncbi:adenine phosphoribosyltransferase [Calderihabitans maritimus]|uniref:adenine phosphoribosyltransferase n=1 Tax=Calderihabitans maritimus TaxID=1246530 RepID=UPI000B510CC3
MNLKEKIRIIPDFPQPGILFKDVTPLLKDAKAFAYAIDQMASKCSSLEFDLIVGPEARGFVIGAPLAYRLGVGFVPVRKKGKLPAATIQGEYKLEYGFDVLEIHQDAIQPGQKVLVVDDLLATGGTIGATVRLVEKAQGIVSAVVCLIELTYLPGRQNLKEYEVISVIQY